MDKGKAWLELPSDLDESSNRVLKRLPKGAGIVNLTVTGTFQSGGHYGHLSGYPYQIVAHKVNDLTVIQRGMKSKGEEEKAEKRWACGGVSPK